MNKFGMKETQAQWISAFKNNKPINPELSDVKKDIYEDYNINDLPQDTKAFQYVKEFFAEKQIEKAEVKITATGYFDLYINGNLVGEDVLRPSFTDIRKTIYFKKYDVTEFIIKNNRIDVILGNGLQNIFDYDVWNSKDAPYVSHPKLFLELIINFSDGTQQIIVSDETWKFNESYILYNNIRCGEIHDMNLYGFTQNIENWKNVYIHQNPQNIKIDYPSYYKAPDYFSNREVGILEETVNPIIKKDCGFECGRIVSIEKISDKVHLITLDCNTVGWAKFKFKGQKDSLIKFQFIEWGDNKALEVLVKNFFQTYIVKCSGGEDVFEPRFSYNGFQYIKVFGDYEPKKEDITIYAIHNDFNEISDFSCDNEIINKIHEISKRSYISNWQSIPTDCPTREKNGWTADGWLGGFCGLLNFDCINGYRKWFRDMEDNKILYGDFSNIIPTCTWGLLPIEKNTFDTIWSGAVIILVHTIYKYHKDIETVKEFYPLMKAYMEHLETYLRDGLLTEESCYSLGDWLDYEHDEIGFSTKTDKTFLSNVFFYILSLYMYEIAKLLNNSDMEHYKDNLVIKDKINEKWFDYEKAYYSENSLTGQSIGILFDIIPEDCMEKGKKELLRMIDVFNKTLHVGIVGAWSLPWALSKIGEKQLMTDILLNPEMPGFVKIINQGATTTWEDWKGLNSHNHPMFGSIDGWILENIGGLNPENMTLTVPDIKEVREAKGHFKDTEYYWKREENGRVTVQTNKPIKIIIE